MSKKGNTQSRLQQPPAGSPDARAAQEQEKLIEQSTPQDVTSVRAKNAGHGKKTADKWNQ